jgi:general secretion pathway protein G
MKLTNRRHRPGFSLIELLAVITIIVILAALTVAGMGYVNEKQAASKAEVQIKLLENAIEAYKLDNGSYPGTSANTPVAGTGVSSQLYRALYLDGATNGTTIYLPQLDPNDSKHGWLEGTGTSTKIVDPWGNEYRYRKGTNSQNPDFDLWTVGKDGKTNTASATHKDNKDDIGNF